MNSIRFLTDYNNYFAKIDLSRSLNKLEKKVAALAVVVFGCLLVLYLVKKVYHCFKVQEKKEETNQKTVIPQEQVKEPLIHFNDSLKKALNLVKNEKKQEDEEIEPEKGPQSKESVTPTEKHLNEGELPKETLIKEEPKRQEEPVIAPEVFPEADDKHTGKGRRVLPNGNIYEGDFVEGVRTGKGKLSWSMGGFYEGEFLDDKATGYAKVELPNGDKYEGYFVDSKRNGEGRALLSNGKVFVGNCVDDKAHGKCKFIFSDRSVYEGDFVDGKCIGKGRLTLANGGIQEGDYVDGKFILALGKARIGSGEGTVPNLMGMKDRDYTIIDFDKLLAAGFACCFHTTESQEEILKFIREIRIKNDPGAELFGPKDHYAESYNRLYNNLAWLHAALPGEKHAKEVKIYWNEQVEKVLFPLFFKEEKINIDHLVFALTPGEEVASPFQAPHMDFTNQLQFVGIDENNAKDIDDAKEEKKRIGNLLVKANVA